MSRIVMLVTRVGENYKGVVAVTWEVAMVMPMEIQGMETQHGDLIHHKPLVIMGLKEMVTVDTVVHPDKPNNSDLLPCSQLDCITVIVPSFWRGGCRGLLFPAAWGTAQADAVALWDRLDCLNPSSLLFLFC